MHRYPSGHFLSADSPCRTMATKQNVNIKTRTCYRNFTWTLKQSWQSVDISYPASELFPQSRASALPSRKYWFSVTRRKKRSNFPEDTFSLNQPTVDIPAFSIYSVKLKVLFEYSVSLSPVVSLNTVLLKSSNAVSFVAMGHRMHLCRRFPINSWRPTRAKTDRAKTVRIMTSTIFFTDWIKAATMVFKPRKNRWLKQGWTHSLR